MKALRQVNKVGDVLQSSAIRRLPRLVRASSNSTNQNQKSTTSSPPEHEKATDTKQGTQATKQKKGQAQLDEELQAKMAELAGDGGASGVEYENGEPVAMKRSVRENMYRYI